MMRPTKLTVLSALLLLSACDTEPSGPLGPSGGENRFHVFIGEEKESFETVGLSAEETGTATITLRLIGSADPQKNAVDDEYSLQLDIHLDRAALLAASAPSTLIAKGSADFAPSEEFGPPLVEYEMDPTSSPIVKGLFFRRTCFCGDMDSGHQTFDGTLDILAISPTEISGVLSIDLGGDVPNYSQDVNAKLSAEFNLALP